MKRNIQNTLGIVGLIWAGKFLYQEFRKINYFQNKVALITGGSKGLGLTLAEELLKEKCQVIICARDEVSLAKAKDHLIEYGSKIDTVICDVGKKDDVEEVIADIVSKYGKLDLIFNNAGIITVGSMESLTEKEYRQSIDIMYWGIVNTTLAAVPYMKKQKSGQIINITSIGGEISVPHLLSYSSAKFAAVGFSKGSASELRKDNIYVTTIVPGLMRTGSYINAQFPKDEREEFKIFSFLASTPGITLEPRRAAKIILEATRERKAYQILGVQNKIIIKVAHLFPNIVTNIFSLVSRFLPYNEKSNYEPGQLITERFENSEVKLSHYFGKIAQKRHQLHS